MTSIAINGDCVTGMRRYPDNYFDLAVVDPPYGGGELLLRRRKTLWGTV